MENKTGKYFKYAIGEIILVVIGILIALQINNWNQERKENKQERFILQKLQKTISDREKQFLDETSSWLTRQIKSRVRIKKSGEKGKIEINFKSKKELQRLIDLLSQI